MKKRLFLILVLIEITATLTQYTLAENVLVQADKQTYNSDNNLMVFEGNVKVGIENVSVTSPKAFLKTSKDGKPQIATFLQGAHAIKNDPNSKSEVKANIIRLSLLDNTIKAEGNTKSTVFEGQTPLVTIKANSQEFDMRDNILTATGNVAINYKDFQTKSTIAYINIDQDGKLKEVNLVGSAKVIQGKNVIDASNFTFNPVTNELIAQGSTKSVTTLDDKTEVSVLSDLQQYDKSSNTLIASGKTKIVYKDYIASGPKAMFLTDGKSDKPNRIVFIGRSKIQQGTRAVEADKIEITMNPKDFKAEGNVRSKFSQVQSLNKSTDKKTPKKQTRETIPLKVSNDKADNLTKVPEPENVPVQNLEKDNNKAE